MSALARYFKKRGCQVSGYDKTRTILTAALENEGILITYTDALASLQDEYLVKDEETLVVYTPAIPKDSVLLNYFREKGFDLQKRSQVLGIISKGQFCIAVAGTHGKTTTSTIIAHILTDSGYGCTAFLGGIATNYSSNFLIGDNDVVVVEADEYDRSFLTLHPDIAVITSMDADHLDIYGDAAQLHESFYLFAGQLKEGGTLLVKDFVFDYTDAGLSITDIKSMLPGQHNVENTTVAIAAALRLGISPEKVKAAVARFQRCEKTL
jgi:UDP-N-acetylmuramate--alanine ligase